jgi:hypothetical protein
LPAAGFDQSLFGALPIGFAMVMAAMMAMMLFMLLLALFNLPIGALIRMSVLTIALCKRTGCHDEGNNAD